MDNQDQNLDTGMQDPQNPDEELELDLEEGEQADSTQSTGDEEKRRKRFDEMEKEELLNVVKRQHGQLKKLKSPKPQQSTLPTKPTGGEVDTRDAGTRLSRLEQAEAKRMFGYENNLSPEETDAVFRLNPNPTKETLADPFVKGGLEAIRARKRVENATPSPSNRSSAVDGKVWTEMTAEERAKNFTKLAEQKLRKK